MYQDPYSVGENEKEAYDQAGSRNLLAPPCAERTSKMQKGVHKFFTRWSELCQITDVKLREPGMKEPEDPSDSTFGLEIHFTVMQDSTYDDGTQSVNRGRPFVDFLNFNIPAWRRAFGSQPKGQAWMTDNAFKKVKSLLASLDLDSDLGRTPRALAEEERGNLLGQKVYVALELSREGKDGEERQNITRFTSDSPS